MNCDKCGACCLEQGSPPGYIVIMAGSQWVPEDEQRVASMPPDAKDVIAEYRKALMAGTAEGNGDGPCCWLDRDAMRCRWYEYRPSICRDLGVGSEGCWHWRDKYNIDMEDL